MQFDHSQPAKLSGRIGSAILQLSNPYVGIPHSKKCPTALQATDYYPVGKPTGGLGELIVMQW